MTEIEPSLDVDIDVNENKELNHWCTKYIIGIDKSVNQPSEFNALLEKYKALPPSASRSTWLNWIRHWGHLFIILAPLIGIILEALDFGTVVFLAEYTKTSGWALYNITLSSDSNFTCFDNLEATSYNYRYEGDKFWLVEIKRSVEIDLILGVTAFIICEQFLIKLALFNLPSRLNSNISKIEKLKIMCFPSLQCVVKYAVIIIIMFGAFGLSIASLATLISQNKAFSRDKECLLQNGISYDYGQDKIRNAIIVMSLDSFSEFIALFAFVVSYVTVCL